MKENGFMPDKATYTIILEAYKRLGLIDKIAEIREEMTKMNIPLDAMIYTILLEGYVQSLDLSKILEIIDEMNTNGIELMQRNVEALRLAMRNVANTGDRDLMVSFFQQLRNRNVPMNVNTYKMLLSRLLNEY
jgi:pentatricopeptide repeat protein